MDELFNPGDGVTDAEVLRRLRPIYAELPEFQRLAKLLGNDAKALRALREEAAFIRAHPVLPRGEEFAAAVRGYLIANKLEWSQENLATAVASYQLDRMGEPEARS